MYSDIVYFYGDLFAPEENILHFREELPNGKKVNQKQLAEQLLLAAFARLFDSGSIDLSIEESKILFIKTKTAVAKKLKDDAELTGLEAELLKKIGEKMDIKTAVMRLLHIDDNPWAEVTHIVKKQISAQNLTKATAQDAEARFKTYTQTLKTLKSKGELFTKIKEAIADGIRAKEEKPERERE